MPTIYENQFFTPIIEFDVAPEQQQAFIDAIASEVERYFKRYAGFVSASLYANALKLKAMKQWLGESQNEG